MKKPVCLAIIILLAAISARADTVMLKDGERLTGNWVTVQGGNLNFHSDTLGAVTVPLSKVASFSTSAEAVIVRTDRTTVRGQLELLPSGDWRVTHAGRSQIVRAASVDTIMPEATYTALVEHKGKLYQDWHGSANLGYDLQRGDQQTGALSAGVAATRERPEAPVFIPHFRTAYSLLMLFSKAQQGSTVIRSNTITTLLREDYLFTPANFMFVSAELDHIQTQGLYLRQTYGGGYGRDLIHSSRTLFSVLGGLTFVNEKFYTGGPARQSAQLLLGERLSIALGPRMHFDHYLNFYPNLSDTGEYHFDTDSSLSFKLTSRIAANISLIDNYLSNPVPGNHSNNVALTSGIGLTF
ncbi:MAG: DUF481 domain-containing protein [Terriglobia bacterium]